MEDKRSNYIALAAALAALGALLVCSQAALESARAGLSLCAQMIVPSLLPFFMLSSLLQQLGLPGILGRLLSPVTQRLFGIGGAGASALLLGVTGGYPLGADAVARLRRSGALTREQAGVWGGIFATLGVVFPSLVIIMIIAAFIQNFAHLPAVQNAFAGIRVCVCVLILNAVVKLWKKSVVDWKTFLIFLLVFAGSVFLNISPVVYVLAAAVAGVVIRELEARKA